MISSSTRNGLRVSSAVPACSTRNSRIALVFGFCSSSCQRTPRRYAASNTSAAAASNSARLADASDAASASQWMLLSASQPSSPPSADASAT